MAARIPDSYWPGQWERSNIPTRFRGLVLNSYEHPHPSGVMACEQAKKFVDTFEDRYVSPKRAAVGAFPDNRDNIGRGLLLVGPNGTRKSSLALRTLTEVQYRSPAYKVFYTRFSDWKKALTTTFEKEMSVEKEKAKHILTLTEMSHLVVLDDIGQEYRTSSGFTESHMHELIRVRYEAARPTIVTTNVSPSRMREVYGDSFDSFRHDAFESLVIVSDDLRKTKDKND